MGENSSSPVQADQLKPLSGALFPDFSRVKTYWIEVSQFLGKSPDQSGLAHSRWTCDEEVLFVRPHSLTLSGLDGRRLSILPLRGIPYVSID